MKILREAWFAWAGLPSEVYLDPAGELRSEALLVKFQESNIQHFVTAEAWQRGRVERHGGILKEMLDRMDKDSLIESIEGLDKCFQECVIAKNLLVRVQGFSPEQLVLGKASKIPAFDKR